MIGGIVFFFICIGVPVGAAIYFYQRRDGSIKTFLVGMLGFFVAQPLLRMSIISILQRQDPDLAVLPYTNTVLYYLILALTAGIFEECARWLCFKFLRKGRVSWTEGVAYGFGHGGLEAFWIFTAQVLPVILMGQANIGMLVGSWERVASIALQIGFSLIVIYSVGQKKPLYLLLAILLHTLVDFQVILGNTWIVEGILTVEAIVAVLLIKKSKEKGWIQKA